MAKGNVVPQGFTLASDTTKVGDVEYPIEYLQANALTAVLAYYKEQGHNGEEVLLGIWNSTNKQNASQGPKESIRKAIAEGTYKRGSGDEAVTFEGDEAVAAAIEDAQEATRTFVTGAPRQSEGFRKKDAHAMGERVTRAYVEKHGRPPTEEEVEAILADLI